eukprot:scaffold14543_cov30-Tisochrysis_lutea.AAC.2
MDADQARVKAPCVRMAQTLSERAPPSSKRRWGMARKINYTGDWLMGLAWSLTCGFTTPIAYFYPVYFAVLLMHRAWRDDHACSLKYGADWLEYKQRVPFVFIPGIL